MQCKQIIRIILLLSVVILTGCRHASQIELLTRAEAFLPETPDSADIILSSIDVAHLYDEEEVALWHDNHKLRLVLAGQMFNLNDYVKYTPDSCTHITYTGLIGKERLNEWYEIADVGVLPSYTEQCSYTGMELMARGKLIVTTNGNNLQDMFTPDMAYIAHIDNLNKEVIPLEKQLERIISCAYKLDLGKKQNMCRRAKERFQQYYSINAWREKYIRLING